jgi:hypothetical protein
MFEKATGKARGGGTKRRRLVREGSQTRVM